MNQKTRVVTYDNGIIVREFCVYGTFTFHGQVLSFNIDEHTFYIDGEYLVERDINWSPSAFSNERHSGTIAIYGTVFDIVYFELFENYILHFITTDNKEIFFKGNYIADIQTNRMSCTDENT